MEEKSLEDLVEEGFHIWKLISERIVIESKILKEEITKIELEKEKMNRMGKLAKSKIVLNVGGKRFEVSKDTLMSYEGSFFYSMLRSEQFLPDENGEYFIDRNPKFFSIILDYLRTGKLFAKDFSENSMEMLKEEFNFYQIFPIEFSEDEEACISEPSSDEDDSKKRRLKKRVRKTYD